MHRFSTADASATSVRSPVFRSLTSITPDASPRPTTTIVGTPTSSASAVEHLVELTGKR